MSTTTRRLFTVEGLQHATGCAYLRDHASRLGVPAGEVTLDAAVQHASEYDDGWVVFLCRLDGIPFALGADDVEVWLANDAGCDYASWEELMTRR